MTDNKQQNTEDMFFLARDVGEQMYERLEFMTLQPRTIYVLGAETEHFARRLKQRYENAEIFKFGEDEILPLADLSVDLIFANLFLPWQKDLKKIFHEWRRILQPEGLLMFTSLGPDTLMELRTKYADFLMPDLIDMHNVGDELTAARYADPVLDTEHLTVTYRDLKKLLFELQATNMLVQDLKEIDHTPTAEGLFPLTYEIVYGHAWGPDPSVDHVADDLGVVKIPLSHLRRR